MEKLLFENNPEAIKISKEAKKLKEERVKNGEEKGDPIRNDYENASVTIDYKIEKKEDGIAPITLETIKNNHAVLEKIYHQLTTEKEYNVVNEYGKVIEVHKRVDKYSKINFGSEYEKTNLSTISFYVAYETGLFAGLQQGGYEVEDVDKYLKLLLEAPEKAEDYIKNTLEKKVLYGEDYKDTQNFLLKGLDLSNILPTAPKRIMEKISYKDPERPKFSDRSTGKVHDILKIENKSELEELFMGKTVIDLGAGKFGDGLKVTNELGANQYVGVEPFNAPDLLHRIRQTKPEKLSNIKNLHIAYTDMRTFLEKIPDNSINNTIYLISGIDEYIFGTADFDNKSDAEKGQKYGKNVQEEILRTASKNCYVITYSSNISAGELIKSIPASESSIDIYRIDKQN